MSLLLLIGLSAVAAVVSFRRPAWIAALALALWAAIPYDANVILTGSDSGFHASSYVVMIGFGLQLVLRGNRVVREIQRRPVIYGMLMLVLAVFYLTSAIGGGSVTLFVDQAFVPFLMFVLIGIGVTDNPSDWKLLRNVVILVGLVEAVLGIIQMTLQENIYYTQYFVKESFWTEEYVRSQGTTAHPLQLGFVCAVAIPLLAAVRSTILKILFASTLLLGVISAQARFALIGAIIAAFLLIIQSKVTPIARIILTAVLVGVPIGFLTSPIALPLVGRFQDDGNSTALRDEAYAWYFHHWTDYLFFGNGMGTSFAIGTNAELSSSFESSFIGFALDFGFFTAAVYFLMQFLVIIRRDRGMRRIAGAPTAALAGVVLALTFSSTSTESIVGPEIWVLLALAAVVPQLAKRGEQEEPGLELPELSQSHPNTKYEEVARDGSARRAASADSA